MKRFIVYAVCSVVMYILLMNTVSYGSFDPRDQGFWLCILNAIIAMAFVELFFYIFRKKGYIKDKSSDSQKITEERKHKQLYLNTIRSFTL